MFRAFENIMNWWRDDETKAFSMGGDTSDIMTTEIVIRNVWGTDYTQAQVMETTLTTLQHVDKIINNSIFMT